jgi:hypothetical protein
MRIYIKQNKLYLLVKLRTSPDVTFAAYGTVYGRSRSGLPILGDGRRIFFAQIVP